MTINVLTTNPPHLPVTSQVNTLYVSTTGSDSNDGLTSGTAFLTIQKAIDVFAAIFKTTSAAWTITLAAGTYTAGAVVPKGTIPRVSIVGPDVSGHPNVPTAIVASALTTGDVFLSNPDCDLLIQDIKITNITSGNACQVNAGKLALDNVHIYNCQTAVATLHNAFVSVAGGIWDGNSIANSVGYKSYYGSTHSMAQASNNAATDALTIKNFDRGVLINEGVQGHLDNINILDCTGSGLNIKRGAGAVNTKTMKIDGCAVGVLVENCAWYNNGILFGGISANTLNQKTLGGSPELVFHTQDNSAKTLRKVETTNAAAHTGTTTATEIWRSPTMGANVVSTGGDYAKITIMGEGSFSSNATIRMYVDDGTTQQILNNRSIVSGVAEFKIEEEIWHADVQVMRSNMTVVANTAYSSITENHSLNLKDKDFEFYLTVQLGATGDSFTGSIINFEGTYNG